MSTTFNRRAMLLTISATALTACETLDPAILEGIVGSGVLSQADAAAGIRAALDNGVGHALGIVGRNNGFLLDNIIKIPLPNYLKDVQSVLRPLGADKLLVELEEELNHGAEKAAPRG